MSALIEVTGLCKAFGDNQVLSNLDLSLNRGESLAIIGASGSGKSILLKCILGLIKSDSGSILFDGRNCSQTPMIREADFIEQFGMLFQGGALFDSLPVWENICFALLQRRTITKNQAVDIAAEKLALVGLKPDIINRHPAELSGGMQKRVALARAIVATPKLIFFDEPTAGLDPISASMISELIAKLTKQLKATALTITHDMRCVYKIANRVAMLRDGNIIWQGDAQSLSNPGDDYVAQFVHGDLYQV